MKTTLRNSRSSPRRAVIALAGLFRHIATLVVATVVGCALVVGCGESSDFSGGRSKAGGGRPKEGVETRSPRDLVYYERVKDDVQQLARMVQVKPDDPELRVRLGEKLLGGSLSEPAVEEFEKALELAPGHEEATQQLFTLWFDRGENEKAWQVLSKSLAVAETPTLRTLEGRYLSQSQPTKPELAEAAFRRALELDSGNLEARFELGRHLMKSNPEEAISLLREVTVRKPNHLGAHYNLAVALRRVGEVDEADAIAKVHRRLSRLHDLGHIDNIYAPEAYLALAYLYRSGGDEESAAEEIEAAFERYPNRDDVVAERAMWLFRSKRRDEAFDAFEEGVRVLPNSALLLNKYAWLLTTRSDKPKDHRRAVMIAERAVVASERKDPNILDTLAQARAGVGNYAAAVHALDEAIRLDPTDLALKRRQELYRRKAAE